eukprot:7637150-Alexandrium_andersonii.AAC.1
MNTPSTATCGAGSGTSSDPARGPPRAAPAVAEEPQPDDTETVVRGVAPLIGERPHSAFGDR